MGVTDLWRLLSPCGHRLSLTTLKRRRLAIDVSIWISQFIKALPSSQPHLLGLLRRLCKLHFYHIYPVCVFDGPAPMLKKRTLEQRRRVRERQRESFERVAERLVLEQLKMKSVKELRRQLMVRKKEAEERKKSQLDAQRAQSKDEKNESDHDDDDDEVTVIEHDSAGSTPSKAQKKRKRQRMPAVESLSRASDEIEDDPELLLLRQLQAEEEQHSAASSLDLIAQWQTQDEDLSPSRSPFSHKRPPPLTSLTAEERKLGGNPLVPSSSSDESPSPIPIPDALADPLSYQLPASGHLDSSVLASLPISLQYSLLEQHRSHHHTLSMRRYAAVKGDMSAFSAMQMGAFLKQVEFNKEIERKRMEMNSGEEVDGMKVRRLAGDGSREFVYSKRDERKEAEDKRRREEAEQRQRREESRRERESERAVYINAHLSRIRQREESEWRCDECGHHNAADSQLSSTSMCHACGARRTRRPDDGGTMNILTGGLLAQPHALADGTTPKREEIKSPVRVTTFHGAGRKGGDGGKQSATSTYWTCSQCSFLNHLHHRKCEICGAAKEDSAQPVLVDLTDSEHKQRLPSSAPRASKKEVIHLSDDDEEKSSHPTAAPIEISFDMAGGAGDGDVFPEDFFSAFEDPASAPLPPLPPVAASPPVSAVDKPSLPLATASLLLPPMTLREAERLRRPRMRLKKLDVNEIIWFDEDGRERPPAHQQRPKPHPVAEMKVAEQPQSDDEVEEVFVRGRQKLVKKKAVVMPAPPPAEASPVVLDTGFLEEEERAAEQEGKYDDSDSQERENAGNEGDEDARDARQQLKEAIALSMSFAVNRTEDEHSEVAEEKREEPKLRLNMQRQREEKVLNAIAQEEAEMKDELLQQQRNEDRDEVVIVEESRPASPRISAAAVGRTVITLESEALTMEQCGDEGAAPATMTVDSSVEVPEPAATLPAVSSRETAAASSAAAMFSVRTSTVSGAGPAGASAAGGFVLPSLSSLSSSSPVKPTNLFFVEKQRRGKEAELQKQAAEDVTAHSAGIAASAPSKPPASSAPVPPSSSAPVPPSSKSSSFSEPAPLATWSSAAEDPLYAADPAQAEQLSELFNDAHVLSSSLAKQKAKQAKQQQQVTAQMLDECRQLLSLFGCPYVISPAEAEAQCATLELLGLVDGVVTEDSDVFLFGAQHVYRNVFEQKKYAERYRVEEIDAALGLDRAKLISLALLLGSDYTEGVHGVGIVNGMEIVNAFPGEGNSGLREFREWVYSGSVEKRPKLPVLLDQVDGESVEQVSAREAHNAELVQAYRQQLFKFKHRNIRSSWHVSRDFPSDAVRQGYEQPLVDHGEEPLSWAKPRWNDIIAFLRDKFHEEEEERRSQGRAEREEDEWVAMVQALRVAWEQEEARVSANPHYQTELDRYFTADDKFAEVRSRRINRAIAGLTRQRIDKEHEHETEQPKRRTKQQQPQDQQQSSRGAGEDKENEGARAPDAPRGKGRGRGRRGGREPGGAVAERLREAREWREREDAEWLDDELTLMRDDGGGPDSADEDERPSLLRRRARGRGRGRGGPGDAKRGRVS